MKNIYKNYLIVGLTVLVVVLLVIIMLLVISKPNFSFLNNSSKNEIEELNEKEVNDNNTNNNETENNSNSNSNSNSNDSSNSQNSISDDKNSNSTNSANTNTETNHNSSSTNQSSPVNNENNEASNLETEADVISYFQNEDNNYGTIYNNQDNSSLREKAKSGFINIVDFIFYGKEIKGYTFAGLTNSAKIQVVKIALTIDHKIEEYFPNYKTIIKDKYTDIKGKLAVKYLELTSSLCDSVGEDTCNQFKEDFSNMKESFGFTWSLIKELAKSGKDSIKNYYENEFRTN